MISGVHHINFIVADLSGAVERFERLLGTPPVIDPLPGRGVLTARFPLGTAWLVLVQPVDSDGVVARHLAEHGEGFFLLSLAVADLDAAVEELRGRGVAMAAEGSRRGLEDWTVHDVDVDHTLGLQIQLCADSVR